MPSLMWCTLKSIHVLCIVLLRRDGWWPLASCTRIHMQKGGMLCSPEAAPCRNHLEAV